MLRVLVIIKKSKYTFLLRHLEYKTNDYREDVHELKGCIYVEDECYGNV